MRHSLFKTVVLALTLGLLIPISTFGWPYSPYPVIPADASPIAINKGFWYGIYSDASQSYIVKANLTVPNDVILLAFPTNSLTIGSGGGGGGSTPAQKRVAMFIITLNDTSDPDGPYNYWTGFEFKASTNNFSQSSDEFVKLQYYAQSPIANTGLVGQGEYIDKMKLFICSNYDIYGGDSNDARAYMPMYNTIIWRHPMLSIIALVDTSCLIRHPTGDWLNSENNNLTWVYLRTGNSESADYESDPVSGLPLWRPIAPVRWFSSLPDWANVY